MSTTAVRRACARLVEGWEPALVACYLANRMSGVKSGGLKIQSKRNATGKMALHICIHRMKAGRLNVSEHSLKRTRPHKG